MTQTHSTMQISAAVFVNCMMKRREVPLIGQEFDREFLQITRGKTTSRCECTRANNQKWRSIVKHSQSILRQYLPTISSGAQGLRSSKCQGREQISEKFYGDGPPCWKVGRRDRSCQTALEALKEREIALDRLRRGQKLTSEHPYRSDLRKVTKLLLSCRRDQRCMSAACPECSRAWQRLFVQDVAEWLDGRSGQIVTIVPHVSIVPGDDHFADVIKVFKKRITRILQSIGIAEAIGGLDLSYNQHIDKKFEPHWNLHIWLFIPQKLTKRHKEFLVRKFKKSNLVQRPVKVQDFNGDPRAFAYAMKPKIDRRLTRPPRDGHRQYVQPRDLKKLQMLQSFALVHKMRFAGRLFLMNVELSQLCAVLSKPICKRTETRKGDRGLRKNVNCRSPRSCFSL